MRYKIIFKLYTECIEVETNLDRQPTEDEVSKIMKSLKISRKKVMEYYFIKYCRINFQFECHGV